MDSVSQTAADVGAAALYVGANVVLSLETQLGGAHSPVLEGSCRLEDSKAPPVDPQGIPDSWIHLLGVQSLIFTYLMASAGCRVFAFPSNGIDRVE